MRGFLCPWMGFLVSGSEFFGGKMGIDLGGGEICMSQEFLNASEVGAGVEKMSGEAVAEFMGCNGGIQAGLTEVFFEPQLDQFRIHGGVFAVVGQKDGQVRQFRMLGFLPVIMDRVQGGRADGKAPFFFSLAHDAKELAIPLDVLDEEAAEFADSQAAGINGFKDGGVSDKGGGRGGCVLGLAPHFHQRRLQQVGHLLDGEKSRQVFVGFGKRDLFDGDFRQFSFFDEVAVEAAKSGEAKLNGGAAEIVSAKMP